MNISFLTSSHFPFDDRIYHHMAKTLIKEGNSVEIVSSKVKLELIDEISINSFQGDSITKVEKINFFIEKLNSFNPDLIICCEPLTIFAAKKYKKAKNIKILYDITEWYPSKKNLSPFNKYLKVFHFIKFLLFNFYTAFKVDGFIFGENFKSIPYKVIFPFKKFIYISYFPSKKLISSIEPKLLTNSIRLSYSGPICLDKGFINFINVIKEISYKKPTYTIYVKIIGDYKLKDIDICKKAIINLTNNIKINFFEFQPLPKYIELIEDTDIFLDLRIIDFENSHCLPIKLFYYMALGRPVIYSNLKAISKDFNIKEFGHLVNPTESEKIASILLNYIKDPELYIKHCNAAKIQFATKYNWEYLENDFLNFINGFNNEA